MKKLTRVRLINWHRFSNACIEFDTSTLLSGENGAGKSTLLDAIQFVVTCSSNSFNKAAHENGKRKLTGYIRCKTGRENKPYERTGEISAHVALEFYEESKKRYFIVGAVIDSATEGQETVVRYLMDGVRLSDELFFSGKTPKSITQFRTTNAKQITKLCKTDKEAKSMVQSRFGRIEEKFFHLIPKAMAFRPIKDIKDFVYSYVLDEKEVNVDILRENVRSYQDLQRTLDSVKERIRKLEIIDNLHAQVMDGMEKDKTYDYYLARAEADAMKEVIAEYKGRIKEEQLRLESARRALETVKKEKEEKQKIRDNIWAELAQDKDFLALDEQKKQLLKLEAEASDLNEEKKDFMVSLKQAVKQAEKLLEVKDADACIGEYRNVLQNMERMKDIAEVKQITRSVIDYKKQMYEKVQMKKAALKIDLGNLQSERLEVDRKIEQLQKDRLSYAEEVIRLMETVKEEFARIGRKSEPRILCELLEITDESWKNAVEGYLNTQRFYVLVDPEGFDIALGIYDKLRKEGKVYGVGLINPQKLDQYDKAPEGTLATVVTSKNKYAKRYINMILGKVQMCDHYNQLKQYPTSITRECMRYQNHVASAIKPEIYKKPYIGREAAKVQLAQAKAQREQLSAKIQKLTDQEKNLDYVLQPLETDADVDIWYKVDVIAKIRAVQLEIQHCKTNIATLEKNSNVLQKRLQLEALEAVLRELEKDISKSDRNIGNIEEKIRGIEASIVRQQGEFLEKQAVFVFLGEQAGDRLPAWNSEYEKQTADKTYEQFRDNYARRKKANMTMVDNAKTQMINAMVAYKTAHDFGAAPSMEGYPEFALVYQRLVNSELLKYEEKVESARRSAEEAFREQFLAKLQENMKNAQDEFKDLNKALKDIMFSNERYEFTYTASKNYKQYYDMIMDDFNAVQGESIFSGIFHENHKEVIDELFDKLALDGENDTRALDEFTDYRTYMDYDIKISHTDGSFSYYSKVCEEKSGGETQTPFYVTVAASFVQLYRNNIGGEAIGLVMFDEAFNNMDDERIGGVLEFLRRLPLQIIIAAPPDKIQYISPHVEGTLLVMTDEKVSFAERYYNGAV